MLYESAILYFFLIIKFINDKKLYLSHERLKNLISFSIMSVSSISIKK